VVAVVAVVAAVAVVSVVAVVAVVANPPKNLKVTPVSITATFLSLLEIIRRSSLPFSFRI
jgi:hypothetical protein